MKRDLTTIYQIPRSATKEEHAASAPQEPEGFVGMLQANWKLLAYAASSFALEHLLRAAFLTQAALPTGPMMAAHFVWAFAEGAAVTYIIVKSRRSVPEDGTMPRKVEVVSPSNAYPASSTPQVPTDRELSLSAPAQFELSDGLSPAAEHEDVESCFFDFEADPAFIDEPEVMRHGAEPVCEFEIESCNAPYDDTLSNVDIVASLADEMIEPTETFRRNVKDLHSDLDELLAELIRSSSPANQERCLAMKRLPKAIEEMLSNAERMESLVAAMRQASRAIERKPTMDVNKTVLQTVTTAGSEWQDCSGVEFALQEDLHRLEVDEADFQVALRELLLNAADAIRASKPNGIGRIRVTTSSNRLREIHVRIEDDGIGMTDDVVRRAFQPGFSTKNGRDGHGLPSAREAMRRCGGRIAVGSAAGKGAAFEMRFPRPNEVVIEDKRVKRVHSAQTARIPASAN